ncbi:MAG: aminoacyl-tRNA hydrolase [Nitratiruptor sp.]|nr:aminoacyl-tRNA hydrolase [Nitratiruptor sp.]NPA83444.1 aminoacyl-tRNA hydrolase [Campylobacterota bacterium]
MHLIVGLGNPGEEYRLTRHNVGFMALDRLIDELDPLPIQKSHFHGALYKKGSLLLLKPMTYMNRSGMSVEAVARFYKIDPANIIVIHDDLDLPLGALRFKQGGSSGGHNGLASIDERLGSDYVRVRIGIGRPRERSQVVSYVLAPFDTQERPCIEATIAKGAQGALALTHSSLDQVRQHFSQKRCPDMV